jgi:hypothetical protein
MGYPIRDIRGTREKVDSLIRSAVTCASFQSWMVWENT